VKRIREEEEAWQEDEEARKKLSTRRKR